MYTVYLAAKGFTHELLAELALNAIKPTAVRDRLVLCQGPAQRLLWAQNTWRNAEFLPVDSIKDAVRKLVTIQRNWHLYSVTEHRRAALIQEALPHVGHKPLSFGSPAPSAPLGAWTLWDHKTVLFAPSCSSPFAHGEVHFQENKTDPPSRAYLKLWELFTLAGTCPKPHETCLDLGAAPGGWTWVLASLGATVHSVDKAALAPNVAAMPKVKSIRGSGFGLDPLHCEPVDWVFSDMICYPERLYKLVERWISSQKCRYMVCTLKFQGATDYATIARFAEVEHSQIIHLSCNRHEVTWLWSKDGTLAVQ